jgi:CSLREA domain-containing protein
MSSIKNLAALVDAQDRTRIIHGIIIAILAVVATVLTPARAFGSMVTVTVTIVRVTDVSVNDATGAPDFYARVNISDAWFGSSRIDNTSTIRPGWAFPRTISTTTTGGRIPIRIEIWDFDGIGSADDLIDVDPDTCIPGPVLSGCAIMTVGRPATDDRGIDITLDLKTGAFTPASSSGDAAGTAGNTPTCTTGADSESATVCFTITIGAAGPETLLVTKIDDTNDGRCALFDCSLREAVTAASDGDTVAIPDLGQPYSLFFQGTVTSPLNGGPLQSDEPGHLKITQKDLKIRGPPMGAIIRQTIQPTRVRVFDIHEGASVHISNLTITGGRAGHTSTAAPSHLHGGGIHNHGTVKLTNVTITGNSAPEPTGPNGGGGLYNAGVAELVNVTIAENTAVARAGGIDGLNIAAATATTPPITQTLKNTLIVDNGGPDGNCRDQAITATTMDGNLQFPGTTCGTVIAVAPARPVLARDPGAKDTYPLAALPQGGAIDAGITDPAVCPPIDQLGTSRPFDGNRDGTPACDIGAREDDTGVLQQPVDTTTGQPGSVTIGFNPVTTPGSTTMTTSSVGPPPPTGYRAGRVGVYYDLRTNARFTQAEVCVSYDGRYFSDGGDIKLFHYVGGSWQDKTVSVDSYARMICGRTTSLATFAIFEANQKRQ